MEELQALHTLELYDRPKVSLLQHAPERPDGDIRGSRGFPIRMRDTDPS